MVRPKHMPQRTCVACRTSAGKRGFVRIVRTPEGRVEVDSTGKRPGRGAYVCASRECWEEALKRDRLGRALRTTISATDRDALMRYAEGLAKAPAAV